MLVQRGMKLNKLTRVLDPVFFDEDNKSLRKVQLLQVLPRNSYDEGHKAFLRRLEQMVWQIGYVHVAPFQREDYPHEGFNDEGG
jgi:hypothetical protein